MREVEHEDEFDREDEGEGDTPLSIECDDEDAARGGVEIEDAELVESWARDKEENRGEGEREPRDGDRRQDGPGESVE